MGYVRFDVGTVHDPGQAAEGGVVEAVLEQDGLERAPPVDMAKLGPVDVERHSVLFPGHTSDLLRVDVQELGLLVEESPDQPRARDPVDGGVLPGHKSHL